MAPLSEVVKQRHLADKSGTVAIVTEIQLQLIYSSAYVYLFIYFPNSGTQNKLAECQKHQNKHLGI